MVVKARQWLVPALAVLCLTTPGLHAAVVVNEVLANEPGDSVTLEWIELFNDSQQAVSLFDWRMQIGTKELVLPATADIDADGYLIICRRLYTAGGSPGFESFWGNNSEIWGDDEFEQTVSEPIEASFSLTNSGSRVQLYDGSELLVSEFVWTEAGRDGYSWERTSPTSDVFAQSIDNGGATPGRINSLTPVAYDLALRLDTVYADHGAAYVSLQVVNTGENTIDNAEFTLIETGFEIDDLIPDTLEVLAIPSIVVGDSVTVSRAVSLAGCYSVVTAALSDDDRLSNNSLEIVVPGVDFPPLILTEVMANPTFGLHSEWVEILNRSETTVDLIDYYFGDSVALKRIVLESRNIRPGEYVVLAQDSLQFGEYYFHSHDAVIQPPSWTSFNNNTADAVRLVDQYGLELDRFSYHRLFDDNFTWSRVEHTVWDAEWSSSENPGGTPGEPNEIYFPPTGNSVIITIEPRVFAPDGSGKNEMVSITVEAPPDREYQMKILDRYGRTVFDFDRVREENSWNGRDNAGNRLPIGIYIVYLEVIGGETAKETVVIAR